MGVEPGLDRRGLDGSGVLDGIQPGSDEKEPDLGVEPGLDRRGLDGSGGRDGPEPEQWPDKGCGGGMGGCWVAHLGQWEVEVDSDYGH